MRPAKLTLLLVLAVLAPPAGADPPSLADALAADAALHAIAPIDSQRAWAAGDRGVLLRTDNGGQAWRRVEAPTDVALHALSFVDADHGWAVGGVTRPHTLDTRGVVLRTVDGGLTWERVDRGPLPLLRAARFFDHRHGLAAGVGTAFSPSGVYQTDDGGVTWRPLPSGATWRWSAGDFVRTDDGAAVGVVAGLRGATGRIAGREVAPSEGYADYRGGQAVALVDASRAWLVGDGALVRVTRDGGRTWRAPEGDFPESFEEWFDWRAVAARGDRVWVAGAPGSVVLTSDDAGASWRVADTGVTTPLRALAMADDRHGWAVGDGGVVLTTRDGGATWRAQRGGDRRAATLVVAAAESHLPPELIAANAAAEGNRTAVTLAMVPEGHAAADDLATRVAEGSIASGADAAHLHWRLPLEAADLSLSEETLATTLARRTDADAVEALAAALRRDLVALRPEVVAVVDADLAPHAGVARLVERATRRAIELAAVAPPPETRLAAHAPRRLVAYAAVDGSAAASQRLAPGDFAPLLGQSPAQWARTGRGLLADADRGAPAAFTWRVLDGDAAPVDRHGDLLAGLGAPRGGELRRPATLTPAGRLDELRRIAQQRRHLQRLLDQQAGDPAWAGQVVELTGGLDAAAGCDLLALLADGYRASGRLDMAADTLYLLARRYPESPEADAALVWLVRYYASGERAHADSTSAARGVRTAQAGATATLANHASGVGGPSAPPAGSHPLTPDDRRERASRLAEFLQTARPELHADPGLRLAAAAAQRARGYGGDAERVALVLSKQAIASDWRLAALAERWLAKPEGLPPEKPLASCRRTTRRPKLDGALEDAAWRTAEPLALRDGETVVGTLRVARDDEFLYLAGELPTTAVQPIDASVARPRDADLAAHDRVVLRLDVDRDYTTAYELTIDHRGWTRDALWGDPHWRPTWRVAADAGEGAWRFEAAISLAELAPPEALKRAAWAVSIERRRPGEAPAAWTGATGETPDAFGVLVWE